jgi:4-hydroxyacetophenone monooxygenase
MTSDRTPALSETELREAVSSAHVPALLMLVYQFSGDERWLQPRYAPTRAKGLVSHDSGGLPSEVQDEIREAAVGVIARLQRGERPALSRLTADQVVHLASVFLGEPVDGRYGPLLAGEIARRSGEKPDDETPLDAPEGYRVIVIGLGVAGIVGAHYLQQMGLEYTLYERSPEGGGVWFDNSYPGAGVDTPSHLYSFSFFPRDWERHFELRDQLHAYFQDAIAGLGIAPHVRYSHEVVSATLDERDLTWRVEVRRPDGTIFTDTANLVISAVGSLNKPRIPNLPGRDTFAGTQFHSSRWPADFDPTGRRIAVVGAGASSMQITPMIAPAAEHVTVFQRTPQWVAPFEQFRQEITAEHRRLLTSVELYRAWYWVRLFWQFGDKVIEALRIDPEWEHPERSVNARNDGHRAYFTRYIDSQIGDRPDLREKVLPDYPPFGKRILLDNGWYTTLLRDDVDLVTDAVASVRPEGPVAEDGTLHEVDTIVWATGFDAAYFLDSLDVIGVGGVRLRDVWEEDNPKAYLGVSVPDFPNFFMLGGPHSFPGSGSFMYFMEVQARYLRRLLRDMFARGVTAIDARDDVTERYNQLVDEVHDRTVWTHPGFRTYYRNSRGRVIFVMPFLNLEYWEFTDQGGLDDYVLRTRADSPAGSTDDLADARA